MKYIDRINNGGNFCGHNPASPVFTLPVPARKGKGGIPRVLTLCAERLEDYYYRPRKIIPSLDLANESKRRQRSERRESCILLMKSLLKRVDLATLKVGIPTASGFMNYTVGYIAKDTGMGQKRVERALSDLKSAGIVTVSQPRKLLPNGKWKGLAAVKSISKHLFGSLGLRVMLKKEQHKASKRQKEKEKQSEKLKATLTSKSRTGLFFRALMESLKDDSLTKNDSLIKNDSPVAKKEAVDSDHKLDLQIKVAELRLANPELSIEEAYRQVELQT